MNKTREGTKYFVSISAFRTDIAIAFILNLHLILELALDFDSLALEL